jgi:hypothetical protein
MADLDTLDRLNPSFANPVGRIHHEDTSQYTIVSQARAEEILSGSGRRLQMVYDAVLLFDGATSLAGDLSVCARNNACVLVTGDLTVEGDVDVDDPCALVVLGDLRCRTFFASEAEVAVAGTLAAEAAAFDLNAGGLSNVGSIRAGVLISDSDEIEPMNSGSGRVIVLTGSAEPVAGLLPSYQDAGPLSLLKAIRRGENVFRSG